MTSIDTQAAFFTDVLRACKTARETRKNVDLQKAAALLDSPRFDNLPPDAQIDLTAAYGAAMVACTGALS